MENKYKDAIRSSCEFKIDLVARLWLLWHGTFTIAFRVSTENVVGAVSDAEFHLVIQPIVKNPFRKLPEGAAELPKE